jgi:hypothetical protein
MTAQESFQLAKSCNFDARIGWILRHIKEEAELGRTKYVCMGEYNALEAGSFMRFFEQKGYKVTKHKSSRNDYYYFSFNWDMNEGEKVLEVLTKP